MGVPTARAFDSDGSDLAFVEADRVFDPNAVYDIGCRMRNLFNWVCDDLGTRFVFSDFREKPNSGDITGSAVF